jgi:hypothetical protein
MRKRFVIVSIAIVLSFLFAVSLSKLAGQAQASSNEHTDIKRGPKVWKPFDHP